MPLFKLDEKISTGRISLQREIRQRHPIFSKLFILVLENVSINVHGNYLNHLRFADHIVVISESRSGAGTKANRSSPGLRDNRVTDEL